MDFLKLTNYGKELNFRKDILHQFIVPNEKLKFTGIWMADIVFNQNLKSPSFKAGESNFKIKYSFVANLTPGQVRDVCTINIRFEAWDLPPTLGNFGFKIGLVTKHGHMRTIYYNQMKTDGSMVYTCKAYLTDFQNNYIINGKMGIAYEVSTKVRKIQIVKRNPEIAKKRIDNSNVPSEGSCFDMILLVEEEEINTHRYVLIMKSQYFAKQLNALKDVPKVRLKMKNVKLGTMKELLYWMYMGKIRELPEEDLIELLTLAIRFQVRDFIPTGEILIAKCLRLDNALGILTYADLSQLKDLKNAAMTFVANNVVNFRMKDLERLKSKLLAEILIKKS